MGQWMAFNREYMPLGYNDMNFKEIPGESYQDLPIYTQYKGITERQVLAIVDTTDEGAIQRNDKGEIVRFFLYNDGTNPVNSKPFKPLLWDDYFEKLVKLSRLKEYKR